MSDPKSKNHWRTNEANSEEREEGRRIFRDHTIWFRITRFGIEPCHEGEPEFSSMQESLDSSMIVPCGRFMTETVKREFSLTYNGRVVKEVWVDEEGAIRNKPFNPFGSAYLPHAGGICGDIIVIMHYAEA